MVPFHAPPQGDENYLSHHASVAEGGALGKGHCFEGKCKMGTQECGQTGKVGQGQGGGRTSGESHCKARRQVQGQAQGQKTCEGQGCQLPRSRGAQWQTTQGAGA